MRLGHLLLAAVVLGCASDTQHAAPATVTTTRTAILERVPVGTPRQVAEQRLTEMGYDCRLSGDVLHGRRSQPTQFPVERIWMARLPLNEQGAVTDVEVEEGLVGP